jgi:hypothetical protein
MNYQSNLERIIITLSLFMLYLNVVLHQSQWIMNNLHEHQKNIDTFIQLRYANNIWLGYAIFLKNRNRKKALYLYYAISQSVKSSLTINANKNY